MAGARAQGKPFNVLNVGLGGTGARPGKDGLNTTAFPSGVGVVPVEITENESPLVFWVKEYLPDSGGAGEFRGGLGQRIEIGNSDPTSFTVGAGTFDRLRNPAAGRSGGRPGRHGAARLGSGAVLATKAVHTVPPGDRIVLELPGGGGVGDPARRTRSRIDGDLAAGLVGPGGAAPVGARSLFARPASGSSRSACDRGLRPRRDSVGASSRCCPRRGGIRAAS